jgi:hypothetical protein
MRPFRSAGGGGERLRDLIFAKFPKAPDFMKLKRRLLKTAWNLKNRLDPSGSVHYS